MAPILRLPALEDEKAALDGHRKMLTDPFMDFLLDYRSAEPFAAWMERVNAVSLGLHCPAPWLPGEFLFIEDEGTLVGRVWIRFELDAHMAEYEGHLGYVVLPGHRRRGYAHQALAMSLARLRLAGVQTALVTCEQSNLASIALLEAAGAAFERMAAAPMASRRRYMLATSP